MRQSWALSRPQALKSGPSRRRTDLVAALVARNVYVANWVSVAACALLAGISAAMMGAATGFAIAGAAGAQMLGSVAGLLIPLGLIVLEFTRRGA